MIKDVAREEVAMAIGKYWRETGEPDFRALMDEDWLKGLWRAIDAAGLVDRHGLSYEAMLSQARVTFSMLVGF